MPIYEFKCMNCQACMEILIMGTDDNQAPLTCAQCGGQAFERVISATHFTMGSDKPASRPATESRTCSGGSCTTWNLPGH